MGVKSRVRKINKEAIIVLQNLDYRMNVVTRQKTLTSPRVIVLELREVLKIEIILEAREFKNINNLFYIFDSSYQVDKGFIS